MLLETPAIIGAVKRASEVVTGPWVKSLLDINCYAARYIALLLEDALFNWNCTVMSTHDSHRLPNLSWMGSLKGAIRGQPLR